MENEKEKNWINTRFEAEDLGDYHFHSLDRQEMSTLTDGVGEGPGELRILFKLGSLIS